MERSDGQGGSSRAQKNPPAPRRLPLSRNVHGPAEGLIEPPPAALAKLQRKGLVRHIGLSNATAKQVAEGALPPVG